MNSSEENDVSRIEEIKDEISELIDEVRNIVKFRAPDELPNLDAYFFEQINEHVNKQNPHNTDFNDVVERVKEAIEDSGEVDNDVTLCPECSSERTAFRFDPDTSQKGEGYWECRACGFEFSK